MTQGDQDDYNQKGCYASNTNFAGRTHYHAPKRVERVLSPGAGLGFELRNRGRRACGTLSPITNRHGLGVPLPD